MFQYVSVLGSNKLHKVLEVLGDQFDKSSSDEETDNFDEKNIEIAQDIFRDSGKGSKKESLSNTYQV